MAGHTPGQPWRVECAPWPRPAGESKASTRRGSSDTADLLVALKFMLGYAETGDLPSAHSIERARAAIAKAKEPA